MSQNDEEEILKKLLPFQVAHVLQLRATLETQDEKNEFNIKKGKWERENCIIDASQTGTGKTYNAMALCKLIKKMPLIICPKSVICVWVAVAKIFGVEILGIANYEMIKGSKYYTKDLELVECPYFEKIIHISKDHIADGKKKAKKTETYKFQLPDDVIVIFDEAHRCKNYKTSTSKLLLSAHQTGNKIMLLSATISDKIECFRPFGVVFGLYADTKVKKVGEKIVKKKLSDTDQPANYKIWMKRQIGKCEKAFDREKITEDDMKKLYVINKTLFPQFGSRLRISELPKGTFPENSVHSMCYTIDKEDEINKAYKDLNDAMNDLKNKENQSEALGKIIRARQRIELLKLQIFLDLANEAIDSGQSVAIFVNYRETMSYLADRLNVDCLIHGGQTMDERNSCISDFQSNKCNVIIATITAGGVGVSLHDLHGGHPRVSIISPTWSGQDLVQCLGRIHRAGSKTPCIQKIAYCAGTYEEEICKLIQKKLINLSGINEGDLSGPKFKKDEIDYVNKQLEAMPEPENINKIIKKNKKIVSKKNDDSDNIEDMDDIEDTDDKENIDDMIDKMIKGGEIDEEIMNKIDKIKI
jgi:superfamily II DNA or RNA helicase